jgi:hypothetical protein
MGRQNARYVEGVVRATRFLERGELTRSELGRIHRLRLEAHAALAVIGRAAESCAAWFRYDSRAKLDPERMSPKLIAACRAAGMGTGEDAKGAPSSPGAKEEGSKSKKTRDDKGAKP